MIQNLPSYAIPIFVLATAYTLFMFYKASHSSAKVLLVLIGWLILQGVLGYSEFYLNTDTMPPRMPLTIVPTFIFIGFLFFTTRGKAFIDSLDLKYLTLLHIVRIPVELSLFWLFVVKLVPESMTFEGTNFDILAGITAPVVAYLYFKRKSISSKALLVWNIVFLLFLFNIVITAVLAVPMPIQIHAFDQPNTGILYFPFVWLPSFIVPLVFLSHLTAIRRLLRVK